MVTNNISNDKLTIGYATRGGNTVTQKIKINKVRLLFYGGAKADSDNNTFLAAAKNVIKDYKDDIKIIPPYEIKNAENIIKKINEQKDSSIQSIDFFSHGGINALYIKYSSFFLRIKVNQSLYVSDEIEQKHTTYIENSADLSEINYNKFTESAKIEIHGCNAASEEKEFNNINFASVFSKYLYNAGKTRAVVIGHVTNANPNAHKTLTGSDYRHGGRRIYHNGKELFFTRQEGKITSSTINQHLEKKK